MIKSISAINFISVGSDSDTPSKSVKFEIEISETMQNQYGKQFKGTPAPGIFHK